MGGEIVQLDDIISNLHIKPIRCYEKSKNKHFALTLRCRCHCRGDDVTDSSLLTGRALWNPSYLRKTRHY